MWKSLGVVTAAAVLAGCATVRVIDSDVRSYTQWPETRQPGRFVFERLPSQQAQAVQQDQVEALALPALEQAGFRQAAPGEAAAAELTVQVGLTHNAYSRAPWDDPRPWGWSPYGSFFYGGRGVHGVGLGMAWSPPTPYHVLDAAVLIRDARTKQVLYESHARHDGRWADDITRAAMFEAALKDFPQAAINPRRVRVEVPRDGRAASEAAREPAEAAPSAPAAAPATK